MSQRFHDDDGDPSEYPRRLTVTGVVYLAAVA